MGTGLLEVSPPPRLWFAAAHGPSTSFTTNHVTVFLKGNEQVQLEKPKLSALLCASELPGSPCERDASVEIDVTRLNRRIF